MTARDHLIKPRTEQLEPPSHVIIQETKEPLASFSAKRKETQSVRIFYQQTLLQRRTGHSLSQKPTEASTYPSVTCPHMIKVSTGVQWVMDITELESRKYNCRLKVSSTHVTLLALMNSINNNKFWHGTFLQTTDMLKLYVSFKFFKSFVVTTLLVWYVWLALGTNNTRWGLGNLRGLVKMPNKNRWKMSRHLVKNIRYSLHEDSWKTSRLVKHPVFVWKMLVEVVQS